MQGGATVRELLRSQMTVRTMIDSNKTAEESKLSNLPKSTRCDEPNSGTSYTVTLSIHNIHPISTSSWAASFLPLHEKLCDMHVILIVDSSFAYKNNYFTAVPRKF
jgi:hypothetical protein